MKRVIWNYNMDNILKSKLFKDTALYSIINILDKAIPFLIMPIIARVLSKEEMGYYSLYQVTFQVLIPILTACIDYPIIVSYFQMGKREFSSYFSTGIFLMLMIYASLFVVSILIRHPLSSIFGIEERWLMLTFIIVFFNFFNHLRLSLWRMEKRPLSFGCFSIPLTLVKNILGLFIIFYFHTGWEGIIIGHFVGQMLFCLIACISLVKDNYFQLSYQRREAPDLLKTGIPVCFHALSGWLGTSLNRIIINSLLGAAATGSFGIGSTFGSIITVIEDACNKAYAPYIYEKLSKFSTNQAKSIVRLVKAYYLFFILLGLTISILGYCGVELLFGSKYEDTRSFIIPVVVSSVINGLYKVHVNFIFYSKKTLIVARNTFTCAIINVFACYILVNHYGLLGAAYAMIIMQSLLYILTLYHSNKLYRLPWFGS